MSTARRSWETAWVGWARISKLNPADFGDSEHHGYGDVNTDPCCALRSWRGDVALRISRQDRLPLANIRRVVVRWV